MPNIGINTTAAFNPSPPSISDGASNINNEGFKLDGPGDSASKQGKAGGILSRLSVRARDMIANFAQAALVPITPFTITGGNMAPPSLSPRSHGNPVKSDDAPAAEDKDSKWRAKTPPKDEKKDAPAATQPPDEKLQTPDEAFAAERTKAKRASLIPQAATTSADAAAVPPAPGVSPPPAAPAEAVAAIVPPVPPAAPSPADPAPEGAPPPAAAMGRYISPEEMNELAYTVGMDTVPSGRHEELETIPVGDIMR